MEREDIEQLFMRSEAHRASLLRGERPSTTVSSRLSVWCVWALVVGLVLVCGVFGLNKLWSGAWILARGEAATGLVTARHETGGKSSRHMVVYTYTYQGRPYTRTASVSKKAWEASCQGCAIALTLDRDMPERSEVEGEQPFITGLLALLLAALSGAIGAPIAHLVGKDQRRDARIAKEGILRQGTVEGVEVVGPDARGARTILLKLRLNDSADALSYSWNTFKDEAPSVGARLAVLYVDEAHMELL